MQISQMLSALDAELTRLARVRQILSALLEDAPVQVRRVPPVAPDVLPQVPEPKTAVEAKEPALTVLQPRHKREYHRRVKPYVPEPRALAAPVSDRPVVVHKAKPEQPVTPVMSALSTEDMEAVMRNRLLGVSA